jgi:hypothetical protein
MLFDTFAAAASPPDPAERVGAMPLDCYNETLSQSVRDRPRCPQIAHSPPTAAKYPTYRHDFSTELALQRGGDRSDAAGG